MNSETAPAPLTRDYGRVQREKRRGIDRLEDRSLLRAQLHSSPLIHPESALFSPPLTSPRASLSLFLSHSLCYLLLTCSSALSPSARSSKEETRERNRALFSRSPLDCGLFISCRTHGHAMKRVGERKTNEKIAAHTSSARRGSKRDRVSKSEEMRERKWGDLLTHEDGDKGVGREGRWQREDARQISQGYSRRNGCCRC